MSEILNLALDTNSRRKIYQARRLIISAGIIFFLYFGNVNVRLLNCEMFGRDITQLEKEDGFESNLL